MEKRSKPTERLRPEDGEVLEEPQEQREDSILEQHMQPTQQAASPAQLGVGVEEEGTGKEGERVRREEREGIRHWPDFGL